MMVANPHPLAFQVVPWQRLLRYWLSLCAALVLFGLPTAVAQDEVDTPRAFRAIGQPTWYDREQDGYAPPDVQGPEADSDLRRTGYDAPPKKPRNKKSSNSNATPWRWRGGGLSGAVGDVLSVLFIGLIAVALVAIVGLLTYHSLKTYMPGRFEKPTKPKAIEIDPAKVADLPFEVEREAHYENPLERARALWQAGRLREALIVLYGYQLLALDQARKIELQKGKTNRAYLRELVSAPRLSEILQTTMLAFEDVYFGQHELKSERFELCWRLVDEFNQRVAASQSPETPRSATLEAPA